MPGNLNGSQTSGATFAPSDALFLGRKLRSDIKSIFLKCRDENIKGLENNSNLRRICYFILSTGELIRVGCIISTRRATAPPFLFNLKKYLVIQDHNMKPESVSVH
ncbi:hypothetical protein NC652_006222 [Populus alba x Populus x berolinensis]|nr:hypothetical protein NC652_006222 [Populus alba x Populus x berolinensis]